MPIEPYYRLLGQRIGLARDRAGLTQEMAAERAGLTRPLWSKIENGRFRVQLHRLPAIAGAVGTTVVRLLAGVERVSPNAARKVGGA